MRHLVQPQVLKQAGLAALITTLASYPRLFLWLNRPGPLWYLEAVIFFCSLVLWGFVFAWHTIYSRQPVLVFRIKPYWFIVVTLIGMAVATMNHQWLDPALRSKIPEDYPADFEHWAAQVLFALFFNQLFFLFAPLAWLLRLLHIRHVAIALTILFGVFVLAIRVRALPTPLPSWLLAALFAGRMITGSLAVWFYLRGGVFLVSWWTFMLEARNLPDLPGNP